MSGPEVTAVLSARDAGHGLAAAVKSLSSQTLADWECVLVDDGSRVAVAATDFADDRVRVVRQDAAGLTAALRRGCAEARGRFIARLDADDECLPERLSRQVEALERDPGLAAVGCAVELRSEAGVPLGVKAFPTDHPGLVAELDALLTPIPHSTLMVRRSALEAAGGYRAAFAKAQDYDLLRRLSERGRLASLPELLVRLTVSNSSVTASGEGGEQFEFCVLGFVCAVLRAEIAADPLDGPGADAFAEEFRRWYRSSRLPAAFRSRLARRQARTAGAEGRPAAAAAALARATWLDPAWPWRRLAGGGDLANAARAWALAWARRPR